MKTTRIFLGLVMLCGTAFGTPAPIITTTPTNGPTTITVHARTTDGKLPVGVSCTVIQPQGQFLTFPIPQPLSLIGTSVDWLATNVPTATYEVYVRGTNYAEDRNSIIQFFSVKTNTHYSIDFVLSRGATFKGRVLDDATGKPIANAILFARTGGSSQNPHTDKEGRYELSHIAGTLSIECPNDQPCDAQDFQWTVRPKTALCQFLTFALGAAAGFRAGLNVLQKWIAIRSQGCHWKFKAICRPTR